MTFDLHTHTHTQTRTRTHTRMCTHTLPTCLRVHRYNWCMNEAAERAPMPNEWSKISEFKQLLIVRALRADRITNALQNFCSKVCACACVRLCVYVCAMCVYTYVVSERMCVRMCVYDM